MVPYGINFEANPTIVIETIDTKGNIYTHPIEHKILNHLLYQFLHL